MRGLNQLGVVVETIYEEECEFSSSNSSSSSPSPSFSSSFASLHSRVKAWEENFVEVEAYEESLVEEHDSREKDKEKSEKRTQQQWEKCSQVEIQQESILRVNTPPHQLIGKEERHEEPYKSLSAILSWITSTSLTMIWKAFFGYMSFMESLAKRRKCKEDVFYVTFMPP